MITNAEIKISANSESTRALLDYVISFSALVKRISDYFKNALDSEKNLIVINVFSELYLKDGELEYVAKDGFEALLKRFDTQYSQSGSTLHEK